jgi:hypothetical protein
MTKTTHDKLTNPARPGTPEPLHYHSALPWSHWLIIYIDNQGHACLLDCDASSAL